MLLYYAIATLHVLVCVILVLVVLLQSGKGADLAGAFGGGATQTAFGSRGPVSFLSKMTTIAAIVFMLTSMSLTIVPTTVQTEGKSVLETTKGKTAAPVKKAPASQPLAPMPTPEEIKRKVEELEAAGQRQGATTQSPEKEPAAKPAESKPPAKNP